MQKTRAVDLAPNGFYPGRKNVWWKKRGHPDIPIPYVLLPVILLPDIPIPDMPKIEIGISIMFDVFLPNIPIPDIYTGF